VAPAAGDEGLPRARRVRKRPEYLEIQGGGRRLAGNHYLLFYRWAAERSPAERWAAERSPAERLSTDAPVQPLAEPAARFGITVTRKVGGAVVRNRVKRWVRESCRRLKRQLPDGLELVIVARPSAANAGYGPTASELANLARRLRGAASTSAR
jgi:ribonuclease P protein component